MSPRLPLFVRCALLVFALTLPGPLLAQEGGSYSTHSFSNRAGWGTHPLTLAYSASTGIMTVDLSSIQGATVERAVFYPHLDKPNRTPWPGFDNNAMSAGFNVFDSANQPIPPMGPRYLTVDLTDQVRAAVASGHLSLKVKHAGWPNFILSLSVTCDRPLPVALPAVTGVTASCRQGDTMITFAEIDPPLTDPATPWSTFIAAYNALDATREVRYRIYRSTTPLLTPSDFAGAELIDEIRPLSCWDQLYFGATEPPAATIVPRYPVDDLVLAPPGTGVYVHRFRGTTPETAYYFVSRMVDGQEDLSTLGLGTTAAVPESTGPGLVLERVRLTPSTFNGASTPTLHYYVRWEAPPTCTLPNTPFDYLVGEPAPAARISPAPVSLALHCWGGSLNGGYLWWYDAAKGALIVATNQYPYDWWTAYNENYGTLKPFALGVVQPFTQARILSFLHDFVAARFPIDWHKLQINGVSMGGSGASMWGIRSGHLFSGIISMVGVHIPANTPGYVNGYEAHYGPRALACRYDNTILQRYGYPLITAADNVNVWDYWDNDQWLRAHPDTEIPWITFANGQNDTGIGWAQAWDMTQALIDTHRGFNFKWGQSGHGERPIQLGGFAGGSATLQFRFNQFVPAAAHCTLDGDLGATVSASALSGQINQYLTWDQSTVVDTATSLGFRIALSSAATVAQAGADITPRRLQLFRPVAGSWCAWQALDATNQPLGSGTVQVGGDGLFTIPGLVIPKLPGYTLVTVAPVAPPATYATWRFASFGADAGTDALSGPAADPDGTGVTNFQRYAHALPARGPVANPVTVGSATVGTDRFLTLTFPRRAVATDLSYVVESSPDLATWTPLEGRTYAPGADPITAQDTMPITSGSRRFLRVRVSVSP